MAARITIERTSAKQPFHVSFDHGNGKTTFWCENLSRRAHARRALLAHASLFAPEGTKVFIEKATFGREHLVFDHAILGQYVRIEIREVDLRAIPAE